MPTENNAALDNVLAVKNAKISKKLLTDDNFEVVRVEPVTGISSAAYNAIVTIKQPIPNTNPVRYSTDAHKVKRITLKEALVLAEIKQNKNGSFYVESLPTDVDGVIELFAGKINFEADEILFAKNGDKLVSIFAKPDSLGFVGGVTLTNEDGDGEVPVEPVEPDEKPLDPKMVVGKPNANAINSKGFVKGAPEGVTGQYATNVETSDLQLSLVPYNETDSEDIAVNDGVYGLNPKKTNHLMYLITSLAPTIPELFAKYKIELVEGAASPREIILDGLVFEETDKSLSIPSEKLTAGTYILTATRKTDNAKMSVSAIFTEIEDSGTETNPGVEFESKLTFDNVLGELDDGNSTAQYVNYGDDVNLFIRGIGLTEPQILHLSLPNNSTTEVGGLPATITVNPDEDHLVKLTSVKTDNLTIMVRKDITDELVHVTKSSEVSNPPIVPTTATLTGPSELDIDGTFSISLDVSKYSVRKVVWNTTLSENEILIVPNTSNRLQANFSYVNKPEVGSTFTVTATVDGVVSNELVVTVSG